MDTHILILTGVAIFILLLLSAFFSGSETALTAASRARMHQLETEGDRRAVIVNRLRDNKERLIGAILLGNNLVNILASALATTMFISLVGEAAVPLATLVMTLLVLIFSEVLPKTYAIHHAEKMALGISPILRAVVTVLAPMTAAISSVVRGVLKLFGADFGAVTVSNYVDELRGAIELHRGPDEEIREERAMLRSILDLADVEVAEIMTHRRHVVAIDTGLPPAECVKMVLDSPFTRLPLYQDDPDNIIGVLHVKDMLRAVQARRGDVDRLDILSIAAKPWFIPDTTTLFDQLRAFRKRHEHFALVVDEFGGTSGIVTMEDIIEEIFGEIQDEHDDEDWTEQKVDESTWLVSARHEIDYLNEKYNWQIPEGDYDTLGGFILSITENIPNINDVVTYQNMTFTIISMEDTRIDIVKVKISNLQENPKS